MADERYEWLDKEAAERLLRGEPVEAADEHARSQAARLSGALYSAGRARYADECGMPGEAAAVAAFRMAGAGSAASAGDTLTTVRSAGSARRPARGLRFGRPVRFGIVAAVAGCALGGVAVAAGTGVLTTPFGGGDDPAPTSSASAVATPGAPADGGAYSPSRNPGETGTPPVSPSAGAGEPGASGGGPGTRQGIPDRSTENRKREWYRKSAEACREYRSGRIAPESKRRLEVAAKGPERVERFCDQLLGDGGGGDGGGGDGGGGDGGGDGGGGDGGGDGGGGDGKGSGNDGRGDGRGGRKDDSGSGADSGSDSDGRARSAPMPPPRSRAL
jgi:hypothetical protein